MINDPQKNEKWFGWRPKNEEDGNVMIDFGLKGCIVERYLPFQVVLYSTVPILHRQSLGQEFDVFSNEYQVHAK